jgi:RNA polymerase sigma-70 factor (ECF subfamily)
MVDRFIKALVGGDVAAIRALLTEDVTLTMPPYPTWYRGRGAVLDSWLIPSERPTGLRYIATQANGQPALATYGWDPTSAMYRPIALDVLTFSDTKIEGLTVFRMPRYFRAFGLPEELPHDAR